MINIIIDVIKISSSVSWLAYKNRIMLNGTIELHINYISYNPLFYIFLHTFFISPFLHFFFIFLSFWRGSPRPCYFIKNRTSIRKKTYWKIFSCQWKVSGQRRRFGRTRSAVRTRYSHYHFETFFLLYFASCFLFRVFFQKNILE